jgi:hypothetical protein
MHRRRFSRFRQVAPPVPRALAFLVGFVLIEGFLFYLEQNNIPIGARLKIRPGAAILFLASVQHGIVRVTSFHPAWNAEYLKWLVTTPWTNEKPLPLGPVELVWEDGITIGSIILLSSLLPEPRAPQLLCAFLLSNLAALIVTFWLARTRVIGYTSAFGLGLAVWYSHQPWICLGLATAVYVLAYEGLRRGLDRLPWDASRYRRGIPGIIIAAEPDSEKSNSKADLDRFMNGDLTTVGLSGEPCGWPFDRLMREVLRDRGISRWDATIGCALGGWWAYVGASFIPDGQNRIGVLLFGLMITTTICHLVRLGIYIQGYRSPLSFVGRIATGRWIIPGYDQVYIAPLATLFAGAATAGLLIVCGLPPDVGLAAGLATTALVALIAPPRLRRWRLTGHHHIVVAASARKPFFIEAG